ncbi:uncharacterized protein LOC113505068 isoform X1 [Trichoplusia ni]|uniref:Uncharacterized protein LOC113505068 isoform X1 n=1 Tax=Trichoplusia ni TaxID=7111 RepID=A0A7E5WRX6_TRINI|nr:uncharacterized protein LOC113505068 isoform X1 [Trichoplusia ni]
MSKELNQTRSLLTSLGFILNYDKSILVPSKDCLFLGYKINSKKFQVYLPEEKIDHISKQIDKMLSLERCKIREFARFVGLLTSACPAIEYGWLYTKLFERIKYLNLKTTYDNYDCYMNIPQSLLPDLYWWKHAIKHSVNKIKHDSYDLEIFSDASTMGWGAVQGYNKASGMWSENERNMHINYLEILAAFFGLKIYAKSLTNCQILLRIDNTTAISYINRMGGIQFPHLTELAKRLWQWCESRQLHVYASYISSVDNAEADAESRRIHPDIEWELSSIAFQRIAQAFGYPEIDLFASRLNKKCCTYVSWHRDPDAYKVNAFTINWTNFYFYAFPPFSVILKTLRKIVSDKARGILIVPLWPTQPWYPIFKSLVISQILYLKPNENLIISPHSSGRNMHTQITLAAAILSGQHS